MKLKVKKNLCKLMMLCMMLVALAPTKTYAASYSDIEAKALGFGVSVSKKSDVVIVTKTVSEIINEKPYSVKTTDKYTVSRNISFSPSCASAISGSINAKKGTVSGELGKEISTKYSFSDNFTRTYSKTITATVPEKSTYKVKASIKGDKVSIYYKYFVAWICTSKGSGDIYVPKYVSWVCC